jgi:hypothetical protein
MIKDVIIHLRHACGRAQQRYSPLVRYRKRDCGILATLLYHALRRQELGKLTDRDARHERRGVPSEGVRQGQTVRSATTDPVGKKPLLNGDATLPNE